MTLAEIALPPSQGLRALLIAAASIAILAAVWIFQGFGYAPCELCLTQRYAFYAAVPLALLTALIAAVRRMAWRGPALRFWLWSSPPAPRSPPTMSGSNTIGGRGRPLAPAA